MKMLRVSLMLRSSFRWNISTFRPPFSTCHRDIRVATCHIPQFQPFSLSATAHFEKMSSNLTDPEDALFDKLAEPDPLDDLRKTLYPGKEDQSIMALEKATSVHEVFDVLRSVPTITPLHTSQAIVSLLHLQKICVHVMFEDSKDYNSTRSEFNRALNQNQDFIALVEKFHSQIYDIEDQILSCNFYCLQRLNVPLESKLMVDIFLHLQDNMQSQNLTTLSYFCSSHRATRYGNLGLPFYTVARALPRLRELIGEAETSSDIKNITICFIVLANLITDDLMSLYTEKICTLIDKNVFNSDEEVSRLFKVLSMGLKHPWHVDNGNFAQKVLLKFHDRTEILRTSQLLVLGKVTLSRKGPVSLLKEVDKALFSIYEENMKNHILDVSNVSITKMEMLQTVKLLLFMNIRKISKEDVMKLVNNVMKNDANFHWHINCMTSLFRLSRITDAELNREFLLKCFKTLERDSHGLWNFAFNYTRHHDGVVFDRNFEKLMLSKCDESLDQVYSLKLFSVQFAFLVAHGNDIKESFMKRYHRMVQNMDVECLRCICQGLFKRFKSRSKLENEAIKPKLELVCVEIYKRCLQLFELDSQNLVKNLEILQCISNVKPLLPNDEVNAIVTSILKVIDKTQLEFSYIKNVSLLLRNFQFLSPMESFINSSIECVVDNRAHVHFEVLLNLLKLCYSLNFRVQNQYFFEVCSNSLLRDFDMLNGDQILSGCLCLIWFKSFSLKLAKIVFTESMMERLDTEIENYEKGSSYPYTLRKVMVNLNRGVCLYYPEYGVPWFHEKYCQETGSNLLQESISRKGSHLIRSEVMEGLTRILGGSDFIRKNVFSPYYNLIDFEIILDDQGKPIKLDKSENFSVVPKAHIPDKSGNYRHLAVKVMEERNYVSGGTKFSGSKANEINMLEIEGYRVLVINPFMWNAMSLGSSLDKENFLKARILSCAMSS